MTPLDWLIVAFCGGGFVAWALALVLTYRRIRRGDDAAHRLALRPTKRPPGSAWRGR